MDHLGYGNALTLAGWYIFSLSEVFIDLPNIYE